MSRPADFSEISHLNYAEQAKWFLNGFWANEGQKDTELIWKFAHKFMELDQSKKKEGNCLDEFWTHKFLEDFKETHTVIALRDKLRNAGMLVNGKNVSLIEYLAFRYNKNLRDIVDAPQGDNQDEVNQAAALLSEAQSLCAEVQRQLEQEKQALQKQREQESASKKQQEALKAAEDEVRKAEAAQQAAVDELKSQEDAYANLVSSLETKSKDTSVGVVTRNKAAAELAQVKSEDPLPLRKAKISQEAALRKVEKERKIAEDRRKEADAALESAKQATVQAEAKTAEVARAVQEAEDKLQEAQNFLEEVKKKGGVAHGSIWWMQRELDEAKKYMPKRKQ
ncbi:hypothetical protein PROFUN_05239 [Planoprotostelium fungivorum]|uniref:Calcium-regulated actin-bundling protein C-terminal domain-containing protein n=1 Tax=Planoprotostelium fungivorum TaxID=1890364 RepID=A0A2P6NRM3_9EUKA|nr:hypothetical protein PROFUN_05239 [Planoprotostelium fungivorum]